MSVKCTGASPPSIIVHTQLVDAMQAFKSLTLTIARGPQGYQQRMVAAQQKHATSGVASLPDWYGAGPASAVAVANTGSANQNPTRRRLQGSEWREKMISLVGGLTRVAPKARPPRVCH